MTDYNQWKKDSERKEKINRSQNKSPSISNTPGSKYSSISLLLVIHSRHRHRHRHSYVAKT